MYGVHGSFPHLESALAVFETTLPLSPPRGVEVFSCPIPSVCHIKFLAHTGSGARVTTHVRWLYSIEVT